MSEGARTSDPGAPAQRLHWATALAPGLSHLLTGQRQFGFSVIALAAFLITVLVISRRRIAATVTAGGVDEWVALLTLFLALLVAWGAGVVRVLGRGARSRRRGTSQWTTAWREFNRNRLAVLGLYLMAALYLVTLLAPYLARYDPAAIGDVVSTRFLPPSFEHLMGTDRFGRDVFTRALYGARISLSIGFIAVGISITVGTFIGALSGFFGGAVDTVLMRFVDMLISFPRLVLLITVVALFQPSIFLVIIVLGLTLWPSTARIVRGEVLSLREREFIQAARALGLSQVRIIFRHLIPNVMGVVIVAATLGIGNIILIEAGLSFLGFGVQPPTPSWGHMVSSGRDVLLQAWWVSTFPGLAIVFTVVAFNLIGDGLRDALDPRLRI